ncbi:MAG: proton-conducting membrane transporter [Lachnospiraceae bacterium]|nr:proton-conducting membrane transporter [Lachnospiraceae bacterium]
MNKDWILLLPVLFPVLSGIVLALPNIFPGKKGRWGFVAAVCALELVFMLAAAGGSHEFTLVRFSDRLAFVLRPDKLSLLFGGLTAFMWLASSVYSGKYFGHGGEGGKIYQTFFLVSVGVIAALCLSGNLVTMYMFYEMMTLSMIPLVIEERTKEAVHAGFEFLFYSIAGAFLGLAGFFIFYGCGISLEFVAGGHITVQAAGENKELLLVACFLGILGFGSKAGMFPLHGWLPVAHPVAPAPASALLSGNVTKMGVLFIIRIVYYVAGADFLRGTWVQYAFLALTMITVLMGSVIASREQLLKRRLAYSTVSQVSYVLFGAALLHPAGMLGALMHVVFHSAVKNTLFLSAGAVIHQTGCKRADELSGIGKRMPVTMWLYTLVSLTLIGIPPTSAFLSKWYLAQGALAADIPVARYLGPAILLVSAVFTAAYLLPLSVTGFLPGKEADGREVVYRREKESIWMVLPMAVLTAAAVGFGIFPNGLMRFLNTICGAIL